ncbi:MAG: ArsA family ATPase [Euryarchaeota archaeon]|nr:ArsA family ATPase [Euryarchaeota archaeon]
MSLKGDLESKRLVVFLGPGGVGKTTLSAAAALSASRHRKTLVMTVDPARRLADAMGVGLGGAEHEVTGDLSALMLDTKSALDQLVRRYAPSDEVREKVLASTFYSHLSDAFAGSEEFVAVGTLDSILAEDRYGLVVVDTPPRTHAIDFLSASSRLVRVFESGLVRFFFKPSRIVRLAGGRFADAAARWTSQRFLHEAAEFINNFDQMFVDLEERSRRMDALLRDPEKTAYYIVTNPERQAIESALQLEVSMTRLAFKTSGVVVNRVIPRSDPSAMHRLSDGGPSMGLAGDDRADFVRGIDRSARLHARILEEEERAMALLEHSFSVRPIIVPDLGESVKDLRSLRRLARCLEAASGG